MSKQNHTPTPARIIENYENGFIQSSSRRRGHFALRLYADRLCYLDGGMDALRTRHGMQRVDRDYRDKYDRQVGNT